MPPLRVFLLFCNRMYVNESPRVPPFHFLALCDIFKFYFVPSREPVIFQSYRAWKSHFGCLESVFKAFHEYVLSIFRKLCASWALDIAPTLDVPVLLGFSVTQKLGCVSRGTPIWAVPGLFLFQLTISLWMVHFLQFSWSTNCLPHL